MNKLLRTLFLVTVTICACPSWAKIDYVESAEDHFTLGNAHCNFGKPELGLTEFDKAIQLNPSYALAYYNRAVLREEKGDKVGALDDYSKAIKFDQNNPKAYFNRYLIRESMGDHEAATNDLNRALQLDPEVQMKSRNKPMKLMQS
jgi:tetratricopeptide (TPR) repeat protein